MKIVAVSDTHGKLPEIPPCDVFVHAGDMCGYGNHSGWYQSNWMKDYFAPWIDQIPATHKIIIAGNHDWIFYNNKKLLPPLNCVYLENNGLEIDGVIFWGSPWTPWFYDWAFNFPNPGTRGDAAARDAIAVWSLIPENLDVLITHGPQYGLGDYVENKFGPPHNAGCHYLRNRVLEIKPKVHIFGHIHGCLTTPLRHADGKITQLHNVARLPPTIIEI